MMIQEFRIYRSNEEEEQDLITPCSILMDQISSAYPGIEEPDATCIRLKCGTSYILDIPYNDFMSIWRACIDKLDINI